MPRLLDTFCFAGGVGMGYYRAGFEVTGVDIRPQPHYPFRFILGDAMEYIAAHGHEYDAIHASPPCQWYSRSAQQWRKSGKEYPDLIAETRRLLVATGKPWVVENVEGAPLDNPTLLCGLMFGLRVTRHRLFETSFPVPLVMHPPHHKRPVRMGRPVKEGDLIQVVGHFSNVPYARKAMGIDWMNQAELAQAIPPAYTQFIGAQLAAYLSRHP